MPNDKVTSSVNWSIKRAYESTFEPGKVVYKEMIEEGMLKRIEEFNPATACKLRIERLRKLLEEEESKLDDLEEIERMNKLNSKKKEKAVNKSLEKARLAKLEPLKPNLATQVKKGNADWKKIAEVFLFDSVSEARDWTMTKLQEECLID